MARAAALSPSRSSPTLPLLPLLLLLLLLLRETGAQDVQVRVPPEVRGNLGGTVQLPCHLLPSGPDVRVSQVTWLHVDATGTSRSVAAFHPSYGPSFRSPKPGEERLSFVTAGQSSGTRQGTETELRDATLALRGLTVEDEGNYTCEFATFPSGTSRGTTWLRAVAQPQNHAETQEVTLSLEPVPVARCVSEGGRPPARISWFSPLDGEARESQVSGPVPGTVTVTSRFTLVPLSRADGVKVTCKVEHESFEEPILLPVTLSVRYPPEVSISGYDDNWYLGRSEATLNCDVRSKPEPTGYDWSTTAGVFPASAVAQGPQLIIHSVDKLVNTTFVCTVTNAVGTGHAEQVVLVRDTPRASPRDVGPVVWGAVGGTLLVLLLLAGGSLAFILLRVRRRRKSPGGGGGGGGGGDNGGGSYDPKTQVFGNGGPVFWTPAAPGPLKPDGKDEEDEEEEEEKAEEGLMLPPPKSLEDDMESQLDGSLISRRAIYV
ncbi:nectin-2 isoform X2 [Neofelis nebulosa]|uniref:nectin-2 isoform X2 n=1 Tax=Neofelis nebulosa TaxID=61452 RepID=UPI00272AB660|nr:nectin-2 isoform X2 [Neofelis nebulosa]